MDSGEPLRTFDQTLFELVQCGFSRGGIKNSYDLAMFDLRQLQVLVAVAGTGSYTAAAESLGYTQPAVSYQMRRLQRDAGTALVVRAGRGVQLTQAGHALVRHAEAVFGTLRAAQQELATLDARGDALVRIAAFQSSCATLVPRVNTLLRHTAPGLRISVHQAEPAEARALLRNGEADLGFLCNWDDEPLPEGEESMRRIALMTDRRCAVLRRDHPLAGLPEVDFAKLAGEQWVMESFRDRFAAACTSNGFVPDIAATSDDQVTIQTLVASGFGITLMSELALNAYMDLRLVARPLRNWPLRCTYALLWPDMALVPAVASVLQAVRTVARDLQSGAARGDAQP
jgi:DNA-binding transcriptional LysR family regulator